MIKLTGLEAILDSNEAVKKIFNDSLLVPIEDFLSRPKKSFREDLINIGFEIGLSTFNFTSVEVGDEDKILITLFENVIEYLHSGSLIIDDIEDQSQVRRGKESLHKLFGVPIALNAGNWLYFWPLVMIQNSTLSNEVKQLAVNECNKTLMHAHLGQALDLGTSLEGVTKKNISDIVFKTMELKTGALTSLAIKLGFLVAQEKYKKTISSSSLSSLKNIDSNDKFQNIEEFGNRFGQLLQIYDDIGNLRSNSNPQKKYEDLRLLRPSFIWIILAEVLDEIEFQKFIYQIRNEFEILSIENKIKDLNIEQRAKIKSSQIKNDWCELFFKDNSLITLQLKNKILNTLERLTHAY